MLKNIMRKIEARLDQRGRLTLPEKIRKHLEMNIDDDVWFDIKTDGNVVVGRIEIKKRVIE